MSAKLQAAWDEHGESAFEFVTLEEFEPEVDVATVTAAEQVWIDALGTFNAKPATNPPTLGHTPSPDTRAKIAETLRGRVASPEVRERMAAAQRGKKHSPETREKLQAAMTLERRAASSARLAAYHAKRTPEERSNQAKRANTARWQNTRSQP